MKKTVEEALKALAEDPAGVYQTLKDAVGEYSKAPTCSGGIDTGEGKFSKHHAPVKMVLMDKEE